MRLKNYQSYALNKLLKYDKSFVFWPRNTGKTYLLTYFIEYFVQNNRDKDILFIVNNININNSKNQIIDDISNSVIEKINKFTINLINNNILRFCCVDDRFNQTLHYIKPDLIIYDEFYVRNLTDVTPLLYYIDTNKCKCVFTSTNIDVKFIKMFDYNNNYYINIMPFFNNNNKSNWNTMNISYVELLKMDLDYKSDELLDYYDVIFQRKEKLKILNDISNGI